jgi:predicted site-specific integrase-resolvase
MALFLKDAAKKIGVSAITLKRWLINGRVADVPRDRNGWRVFSNQDVERIRAFANRRAHPTASVRTKKRKFRS